MAEITALAPPRVRMTIPHGGAAVAIAAATKIAADHSILAAIITASSGVLVVVIGPFVTDWIRRHRNATTIDHNAEHLDELLHLSDHYLTKLEERDAEIERLREQVARRRRR